MPYHLQKSKRGFYVVTNTTGRKHSINPLAKTVAERQLRALMVRHIQAGL